MIRLRCILSEMEKLMRCTSHRMHGVGRFRLTLLTPTRLRLSAVRGIAPICLETKVRDTCRVPKEKRRDGKEVDIERRAAGPDRVASVEQRRACSADSTTCRDIRADPVPVAR